MKSDAIKVSRTIEIPGQSDQERSTTVTFRTAETAQEMLALCGGDASKAMSYFNAGRWSEFRTKVSNALAGKTPEQRAVDKMVAAFKSINPSLSDEQVRSIVLAMPNMASATAKSVSKLPDEIDESYFEKNPEAEVSEAAPAA
jgi:hypothetical protein